ncbi:MAG: endonuclease/exonuclease/phosphatase family protein [Bacteroidales bacterium]|nr:endonuclease/exonuclease/phosphatase family protein [Bacteroidales bacterium]
MAGKNGRRHSIFFGITARTLMTISAALLLLSYLASYINPAKAWYMTIFGLLYAPLLIINLLLFVWAVFRHSRTALIPLIALVPSVFLAGKYFHFSDRGEDNPEGLKIISYNVGRFALSQYGDYNSWKECCDSLMVFLKTRDADIICLQEFYADNVAAMRKYIATKMKGYNLSYFVNENSYSCSGNVTLSKFPVKDKGRIDFEHSANLALYTDFDIGGTRLRVYNCHFQSYNISLSHLAQSMEDDYRKTVRETEEKMKRSIIRRPVQVEQVMDNIENCPVEALVAGDFNDTPMSYTYFRLSRKRKDSFEEAGSWSGATFSRFRPFLRIDYILFPKRYNALSHKVLDKGYSDHFPIEAVLDINK